MKTNRSLLVFFLLSIVTLGIYSLFFWHGYARDMNIVCANDGKKTRGILAMIVFSLLTFGIYGLVWMYGVGDRIAFNSHKRGIYNNTTGSNVLLWNILGSFILIGPFVALHKLIDGLNKLSSDYNATSQTRVRGPYAGQAYSNNLSR